MPIHRTTPLAILILVHALSNVASANAAQEQVLVTANRVSEDAKRLPLSWSAVDSNALQMVAPVHINEIMQQVPGAWISRGNGQESLISLRSPVLTGPGSCGAFFTAADGISLRAPGFCNVNQLFDANFEQASRIEVIKGPPSAVYGSNAMHGVINVISAPPTSELDHALSVEAGPYDYYRGKYHYRNTFGAHGLSLNVNGVTDGGYKRDSGYDQQKTTLRHDYTGALWDIQSVLDGANLNQETAGFIEGFEAYKDGDLRRTNPNPEAYRDAWSVLAYSRAERQLGGDHSLTLTPYFRDNDMEFLQHFLPWQPVEKNGHTSYGLRSSVRSDLSALRWINGIDLEYTDAFLKEVQAEDFSPNQPAGVHYDYRVDATTAAAYTQLRSNFDSAWEIDGGVRFEYTNYDYDNRTGDGSACGPEATNCRFFRPADRDDDFNDWSFNAGASYSYATTHLVYLRAARGFRAPQATELYRLQSGQEVANLKSEELENIELGLRGNWATLLSYDVSVYYMEKDNVIFQDANRQNISGAATDHYGMEASVDWFLAENWLLEIDASFASHTYADDVELLGSDGNIGGNDIDTSPEAFGSARLNWDFSQWVGRQAEAALEWVYMDDYYLEPNNEHKYDGHSLFNLRFSSQLTPRWGASLRVTNLLDEEYAERADFGFGSYRYFVGQPTGVYGEISYQFGVGG
ncbi:MAG: TonB-dependent receptor [Pseudomonadota bacterium]